MAPSYSDELTATMWLLVVGLLSPIRKERRILGIKDESALHGSRPSLVLTLTPPKKGIFTEANLYDRHLYSVLENYARKIESYVTTHKIQLPARVELVLDLILRENTQYDCGYYFADHDRRCLFWLDDHDVTGILSEVKVPLSSSLVGEQVLYIRMLRPLTLSLGPQVMN